jgi:hypothetical protein
MLQNLNKKHGTRVTGLDADSNAPAWPSRSDNSRELHKAHPRPHALQSQHRRGYVEYEPTDDA